MATLQQVARQAGVSIATVSKVLSNTPYFTEETRQKVMQAVTALGYQPNLAARALSSGKTHIIGVVFPYIYDALFTDPLVLDMLQGIEAECYQHGYNLLLSTPRVQNGQIDEGYLNLIRSGYLDGVIALDSIPGTSLLALAQERGLPCVNIGYNPTGVSIRSDDEQGGRLLMQYLLDLGHRQMGLIAVPEALHFAISHRLKGLGEAAAELGLQLADLPRQDGDFSLKSGHDCAAALLEANPKLTALICLIDRMALGALQYAQQTGRQVPEDLSIVGYDDIPTSHFITPALTTINQKAPQLGQMAAAMLFQLFTDVIPDSAVLATELVIRQSAAPPNSLRSVA
jgi:DNA-binding LacI/PurR family transcriptional regulator